MARMRVLVAGEFSGIVRDAFALAGHDTWSCDLLASERGGQHISGDVGTILADDWDLMIAHPPCTHLAVSGARWFKGKNAQRELFIGGNRQEEAIDFVRVLFDAPIQSIALENPVSILSTRFQKPTQIIQPWQFGESELKTTCLWLKNLPALRPTHAKPGRLNKLRVRNEARSPTRWKQRSRTYLGIALAMARQWGGLATWVPCPHKCGEFLCTIHQCHVFECECPPIEEWTIDPYAEWTA